MVSVTLALPKEAADRLVEMYRKDPEGMKKKFKEETGLEIEDILPVTEGNKVQ